MHSLILIFVIEDVNFGKELFSGSVFEEPNKKNSGQNREEEDKTEHVVKFNEEDIGEEGDTEGDQEDGLSQHVDIVHPSVEGLGLGQAEVDKQSLADAKCDIGVQDYYLLFISLVN